MRRVLLTILGKGLETAEYALFDQRHEARLAPVALFHLLPANERPDVVAALCTEQARAVALPELENALSSTNTTIRAVMLPAVGEAKDVDNFLTTMVRTCEDYPDATFTVDVTHGPRHLSFLAYVGVLYLSALGRVEIGRIHYAWYNPPPQVSPFFDLMPLLRLPNWIHAVRTLREAGSAKLIGQLVHHHSDGSAIEKIMERVSDAHAAGLPIELGREVDRFFSQKTKPFRKMLREDKLPLSERVAGQLEAVLAPYRLSGTASNTWGKNSLVLDEEELKRQAKLVDDLLKRRNLPAALGLMNEWTVSWVLWNRSRVENWLDYRKLRRIAAGQIGALAEAADDPDLAPLLTPEQRELAGYWRALSSVRNALHHHGMRYQNVFGNDFDAGLKKSTSYWKEHLRHLPRLCFEFGGRRHRRLLVSPIGERPGVLFSAVKRAAADGGPLDFCLVVCSGKSDPSVPEALSQAGFAGEHRLLRLEDPYAGKDERKRIIREARRELAVADEVLVNITGGTTLMGVVAEDLANEARRFARPVRRFALIDKRPPEQQKLEPFVEGDILWLDEEERDGDY